MSASAAAERRRKSRWVSPPGGQKPSGSARQLAIALGWSTSISAQVEPSHAP